MSKNNRSIKFQPQEKLPTLQKIKTTWDLKKYFYTSEQDPRIEKDLKQAERAYETFARTYRKKNFTRSSKTLLTALTDYEKLMTEEAGSRAAYYFHYRHVLNAKDATAEKRGNLIHDRLTKAGNSILFFELAVGKISKKDQKKYLQDPTLSHFHYYLTRVFLEAKHTLTEAEERILSLTSGPASHMWVAATEKIISNRMISFEGTAIAIPEALETIELLPSRKKPKLWSLILDELAQISEVAENEFNAIVTRKKISDELRGYQKSYSATVRSYENNEKSVEALVDVVSTDGFKLSQAFYKLKARFHGVKTLPYVNKYDPIAPPLTLTFADSVEICRDAFYQTKPEYGRFFDQMLEGGNIDVYPKKGKQGGAFMSSHIGLPTFVFLNHTDTFKSLETLAHEMGHALHSARSKTQKPLYEHYSTTTAETASTLFENIVYNHLRAQADERTKITLLHDRITRDISTIQRQICFYNFELELHTTIRTYGAVTKEELQIMMQKHLKAYLGPAVEVTERDGLSYVYVPHFRFGFYVYTYTYGILVSSIMADRLSADKRYVEQIDRFLTAGGSDTVENIFKKIDIDTSKVTTFKKSLDSLREDINTFRALTTKTAKKR